MAKSNAKLQVEIPTDLITVKALTVIFDGNKKTLPGEMLDLPQADVDALLAMSPPGVEVTSDQAIDVNLPGSNA
ncbi:MAG: hypothetical protein M0P19_08345 [Nevskia sp.]|nr:hypothetical protein [Nevskia sp.]MCK9385058.1 hypothetical protein [Nevskia sp.]